jgi:hypothetical protein
MMNVWLNAESDAELETFQLRVVYAPIEASQMREANAREALKGALREFPEFEWSIVPLSGDKFLVQGISQG